LRSILENVFLKGGEEKSLRLSTGLVGEGRSGFVELRVWYDGEDGVLGVRREGVREAGLEYENWSLALALARRVMVGNRGEMQISLGEGARTAIRLRFPVAISAERRIIKESHA